VCLVIGLVPNYNPRWIKRYLDTALDRGASPLIFLNKADVCLDLSALIAEAKPLAHGIPVVAISAIDGRDMETITSLAGRGQTLALVGSSCVGKSSIINRFLARAVKEVRETVPDTGRGLRVTTARHLFLLHLGGMIMDAPEI
jgi:ribosome biogenesis GTPase / thiamine phosphate phosphatase